MTAFRCGECLILVATNMAGRGLDVKARVPIECSGESFGPQQCSATSLAAES